MKYLCWAVIVLILTSSIAAAERELIQGEEDKTNVIYSVEIGKDGVPSSQAKATVTTIPPENIKIEKVAKKPKIDEISEKKLEKIHPKLKYKVKESSPFEKISVIINLVDNNANPPPGAKVKDDLTKKRNKAQEPLIKKYKSEYNADVIDQFWLINAIVVEIPAGNIEKLSEENEVTYIQPQFGGEQPPDANPWNDVDDGRSRINSDPYFGYSSGYIGLLDTGVRASHTLFTTPLDDNLDYLRDCVNGGANCNTPNPGFNPDDDCWNHGTSTAAIIMGNANLGNAYRGVTNVLLDSWKVYPSGCGGLNSAAVVRGFQNAVAVGDKVIVAEMQSTEAMNGAIATAADAAFDQGAVVIAANGNNGPAAGTVNSPALAHKVIGVGAYDVQSLATPDYQSRGPTSDGRIKPDIQAPTNTETASRTTNTALQIFGGTSGATPYGAGGAALLKNWLSASGATEPGHTYARLILSGNKVYPFDNIEGGGDMVLPTKSWATWGKVNVNAGSVIDIPITVGTGKTKLEAALWWPEGVTEAHDDVDLAIINPSGTQVSSSISSPSVFEHAKYTGNLAVGTWKIRIRGYSIPSGPQATYYAVDLK
jgi:hypothetical protein